VEAENGIATLLNLLGPHVDDWEMSVRTTYDLVSATMRHLTFGHHN